MDAVSMLEMVVTDYFRIGGGYRGDDPGEAIVDKVVMELLLTNAIKIYIGEKLLGEYPRYTSMATRERQARRAALVHLWREFVLLLSDASINASASRLLATYSRILKRYGEYAVLLGSLALQHTVGSTSVSPRLRIERTVRELNLPRDPSEEERAARVVALLERGGLAMTRLR